MRKTLTLTVDQKLAEFIDAQPGLVDPSEFVNRLFHQDMQKKGFQMSQHTERQLHDDVVKELELMADGDIPAAG
jgi:hypothetical protein